MIKHLVIGGLSVLPLPANPIPQDHRSWSECVQAEPRPAQPEPLEWWRRPPECKQPWPFLWRDQHLDLHPAEHVLIAQTRESINHAEDKQLRELIHDQDHDFAAGNDGLLPPSADLFDHVGAAYEKVEQQSGANE